MQASNARVFDGAAFRGSRPADMSVSQLLLAAARPNNFARAPARLRAMRSSASDGHTASLTATTPVEIVRYSVSSG